jgi:hypothetical protein
MVRAARAVATATKVLGEGRQQQRGQRQQQQGWGETKRTMATKREIVTVTRVAGEKKGNGEGGKSDGNGNEVGGDKEGNGKGSKGNNNGNEDGGQQRGQCQ